MTFTRRVVSGTSLLTFSNGVVRLLSIVTMPILTGLLSPQAYGVAALAGTTISLDPVLALAGIDTSYLRAYHSAQPPSGACRTLLLAFRDFERAAVSRVRRMRGSSSTGILSIRIASSRSLVAIGIAFSPA